MTSTEVRKILRGSLVFLSYFTIFAARLILKEYDSNSGRIK